MIYSQISTILLLSVGFASIATANSPISVEAREIEIIPRQFGKKGGFKGKGTGAAANTGSTGTANANTGADNAANSTASTGSAGSAGSANAGDLQLNPANVQNASDTTGQDATSEAGQADSATDPANFINFCTGKTITNGLQVKGGSCNGIVMGDIPASNAMVSSIITNPLPGQDVAANQDFNVTVQMANLQAGSFTNPDSTYYAAPQALSSNGQVIGHTHVTIQDMGGSLTPTTALDAGTFAFFKGINDAGNGQGLLSATVTGGLPAGNYRVCTMSSSSNHQPVLMPVAQRGAQDDCTKFTIGAGSGTGTGTGNAGAAAASGTATGNTGAAASSGTANTGTANTGTANTGATGGKKGGFKGFKGGKGRRSFSA